MSWGFKSDRIFKLQKRAARIITCSKYNAHTEPLLKTLLNQMIIIHMILDISLFYINYQQRQALDGYV